MPSRRFISSIAIFVLLLGAVALLALIVTQGAASPAAGTQLTTTSTPTLACTPTWEVVPSPNAAAGNRLFAVAGSGNDIWAVGSYPTSGVAQTLTMHWDGAAWSIVPSPNVGSDTNELFGVTGSGTDVWAVGDYWTFDGGFNVTRTLILHWDGLAWSVVPSPHPGFYANHLYAAAGSGSDVWAVGWYTGPDQHGWTFTLHWDGSTWTYFPSPNGPAGSNNWLAAVTGSGTDVWAAGYYNNGTGPVVLHWNGSTWSLVPVPTPGFSVNQLNGISGSGNDVWAVGIYDTPGDIYRTLTLHWDGSAWTHVPSPNIDGSQHELVAVTGNGSDVWAIGNYRSTSGYDRTLVLQWDGSAWSVVPSPDPGAGHDDLTAITASGNDVWTVGSYSANCCNQQTLTLHWGSQCTTSTPTSAPQSTATSTSTNTIQPVNTATRTITPSPTRTPGSASTTPTTPAGATSTSTRTTPTVPSTPTVLTTPTTAMAASATAAQNTPTVPPTSTFPAVASVTPTPTACTLAFSDVPPGSTFYPYIHCLTCLGIVNGYSDGTFHPGNNVTRGQIAKIVSNSAGFSDPETNQTFEDVPIGSTFHLFVGRLASRGILSGYPCGGPGEPCISPENRSYFRPNGSATRGQIMKIDVEAAISVLGWTLLDPTTNTFQDVPSGSTFFHYIETAYAHSVVQGYPCGAPGEPCIPLENRPYFRPTSNVTRGQTTKIVSNTFFPSCQPPSR